MKLWQRSFIIAVFSVLLVINSATVQALESTMSSAQLTRGAQTIEFQYPSYCSLEDEGNGELLIYLNETDYIVLAIPKDGMSGVEKLHDNIGEQEGMIVLTDDLHVHAIHGIKYHWTPALDIISIGLNIPNSPDVIVSVFCASGTTEIYDVLVDVLNSFADVWQLQDWLHEEWIPFVSEQ